MKNQVILSTEGIEKRFTGTHALKGVSVQLRKGEIHALVGENGAGKSTLMNIISGVLCADGGKILLDGKEVNYHSPNDARMAGVGFVHQELALFQDLSVGNNVFVGHLPRKNGVVDRKQLNQKTREILGYFGESGRRIDPEAIVSSLSVAQQQMVEIAKALSSECKVLIFDEPTSSLNDEEAAGLFGVIKDLAKRGIGVFYISHKMAEIFELCDTITIMRDGSVVDTISTDGADPEYVIASMVGREMNKIYPDKGKDFGNEILKVEGISRAPTFQNISFSTRKGEILGLCGLVGAGRSEIARAICGVDKLKSGKIFLDGRELHIRNCADALKEGICYLTEDRKLDGLFLDMALTENMIAPQVSQFTVRGMVSKKKAEEAIETYKGLMNIKFASPNQTIGSLSGGNQQKLMIGKILAMKPRVIFLDEPTRGIDVGAKVEIHQLLRKLSADGISVIVISSEMPEVVGVCDRVVVINVGEKIGELAGDDLTQNNIVAMISESNKNRKGENHD